MNALSLPSQGATDFPAPGPVALRERIKVLDVLRGFALLGILVLNIDNFVGPEAGGLHDVPTGLVKPAFTGWHAGLDYAIFAIKWTFFEGKMRGLFALLFGASTLLLLERLTSRAGEGRAADIFHRRNMWLLAIGIVHGTLIWAGDILTFYALLALVILYPLRNVRGQTLLASGLAIWLVAGTLGVVNLTHMPSVFHNEAVEHSAILAEQHHLPLTDAQRASLAAEQKARDKIAGRLAGQMEDGRKGVVDAVPSTTEEFTGSLGRVITSGLMFEVVGAIIAGMGLYRLGYIQGLWPTRHYVRTALAGYALVVPLGIGGVWVAAQSGFAPAGAMRALFLPYIALQIAAVFANSALLILLVRHDRLRTVTTGLSAVGRMAISNYLLTSITCRLVFSWSPLKLYGTLEFYQYLYVVAAVWAVNIIFSTLWLRYFAYGPMEWVWRSLTYWRRQPMRLHPRAPADARTSAHPG